MPEWNDTIAVLFFTIIPLVFLLLQGFMSLKKQMIWGFLVPILWSLSGAWIESSIYRRESRISIVILITFVIGDIILFTIFSLIRFLRKNKK
jgi:uncharacterized membrane protein YeaQ/YmgE (transglycosylase-associated protein family)